MINVYGYVRVSTKEQNEGRQLVAMQELNIPVAANACNMPFSTFLYKASI